MATPNQAPATSLTEDALDICEVASAVMEKAAEAHQQKIAEAAAVEAQIPGVLVELIGSELIEHDEKSAAVIELRKPTQVLEMLKLAAITVRKLRAGQETSPFQQVDGNGDRPQVKAASFGSIDSRRSQFEAERDAQFDREIGIAN